MPASFDPSAEVEISKLSPAILTLAHKHVQAFLAVPVKRDHDWDQITFAPVARYIHDPGYQKGTVPAYVELRVVGANKPQDARGYILISLTEEDYPVPEFATRGGTKTDRVARTATGGTIHRFMRFGPGYITGEDKVGGRIGALGTHPLKYDGPIPPRGSNRTVRFGSDINAGAVPGPSALNAKPAASYQELKADFQSNPLRLGGRAVRGKQTEAVWRMAKGTRNTTLQLQVGQTQDFLVTKTLAAVDAVVLLPKEMVRLSVLDKLGFRATGVSAGSLMVRVEETNGAIDYYTITVAAPASGSQPAITVRDQPFDILDWVAGTDWDGDQRQYDQLQRNEWCPCVGCGPTAFAMMLGWWDVNGVPAAFYRLAQGRGDPHHFRFNYESLRDSDAPKDTSNAAQSEVFLVPLLEDLFQLSHTHCWGPASEQGTTDPDQMVSTFREYARRICDPQPAPENEYGEKFVVVWWGAGHVVTPGFGETDWEGGGKLVAKGIQAGNPGVVGIGSWAGDLHYPLAYGYRVIVLHSGSDTIEAGHYFKCNMGWGPGAPPEFHRAEDVWFGLSAHFSQMTTPTSANDIVAATLARVQSFRTNVDHVALFTRATDRGFQDTISNDAKSGNWPLQWSNLPPGEFVSGPAACVSANAQNLHVFGRGNDARIWREHSPDGGQSWDVAWDPIGTGIFNSSPAACVSADGQSLHVFGRGTDDRIWRAHSPDGGGTWDVEWAAIGDGVFNSGPAACVSANGQSLYVFGRGKDDRIYWSHSPDGGWTWDALWGAIGDGTFSSSPAASVSADGQSFYVFGRGKDDRIYWAHSPDGGGSWDALWGAIGEGTFLSSPAAVTYPDGQVINVFGVGKDLRVWRALSTDGGNSWPTAWTAIDGATVF
jgi:hypothetical protein